MTLEMYVGPMYAGKTTKMIQMYRHNPRATKISIDFNTSNESNRVFVNSLQSHDQCELQGVYKTKELMQLWKDDIYAYGDEAHYTRACNATDLYINECQFFPDLKEFVLQCIRRDLRVYLYGLDGDFKQDLFGQTMMLIPYCSHLEKLQGTCKTCSNPSVVSYRTCNDTQIYLPNSDCYVPLCLKCHKEIQ